MDYSHRFQVPVAFSSRLLGYNKLKELLVEAIRHLVAGREEFIIQ